MKFKLPRQIISEYATEIISREMKRQKIPTHRANKNNLKEIAAVSKAIQKSGLPHYLVRRKLPNDLGYGIFLHPQASPLLKGQVIAPYAGEVSLAPQNGPDDSVYAFATICDIRLTKEEQSLVGNLPYHPRRLYLVNLDALRKGNFTRFINHSETPNVIAHLFRIPPNTYGLSPAPMEVIYLAKKKILPGEQLLVCYEDEEKSYWDVLKINPFPMTPQTFSLSPSLQLIQRFT